MKNLTNIKDVIETLYEASKVEKNFRYVVFAKVAFGLLHQNRDKCLNLMNGKVAAELRNITIWRQSHLLYCRNEFLKETQKLFDNYRTIKSLEKDLEKQVNLYIDHYCEYWIENLAGLKYRCEKDGSIKVIKDEVEKLLEDGTVQFMLLIKDCLKGVSNEEHMLLIDKLPTEEEIKNKLKTMLCGSVQVAPDKCFILPVLVYSNVMKQLMDSHCYGGFFSSNIPHFTDIFEQNINREGEESSIRDYIMSCSSDKLKELCKEENIQHDTTIMDFISSNITCYRTQHLSRQATREEMKRVVLVQILNEYINQLKKRI